MKDKITLIVQWTITAILTVGLFGFLGYLVFDAFRHPMKKVKKYINPRDYEINEPDTVRINDSVYIFSKRLDTVYLSKNVNDGKK